MFHGGKTDVLVDSGYRSLERREETKGRQVNGCIARMPGRPLALNPEVASR
jgi:IS5 family transposase